MENAGIIMHHNKLLERAIRCFVLDGPNITKASPLPHANLPRADLFRTLLSFAAHFFTNTIDIPHLRHVISLMTAQYLLSLLAVAPVQRPNFCPASYIYVIKHKHKGFVKLHTLMLYSRLHTWAQGSDLIELLAREFGVPVAALKDCR